LLPNNFYPQWQLKYNPEVTVSLSFLTAKNYWQDWK
jgi:hypothetical protein